MLFRSVGITVEESAEIQKVEMKDDTTKIYIEKIDGPAVGESEENPAYYTNRQLSGARIALYPARMEMDPDAPEGYRLMKVSDTPLRFETTDSRADEIKERTAVWTTESRPIYLEGIPAGWYILEELEAPEGFVKSEPVYVRVENQEEIVNILMADDHTKIAFEKYAMEEKEKRLLNGAKFTLYQAKTDEDGEIL